jgi:predicted protein tyrosine phosphatase
MCPRVEHESADKRVNGFADLVQVMEKQRRNKVLNLFNIMAQNKVNLEPL